ncbi:BZ3500_MvSof-1268-A1-R1_Chr11-2g03456 [Microbotryum saponariae]|uniref:BZ3500_MvSof-1268-A1-R1_Chr11-2g03456 protein n=1 Tax=Microbotryum saponariae TaxID=289078 RepID=A0A2X0KUB9_9BASI|nr:BZ3500_MvSof-1268-A1-R1_Chr11-2g03456 [Microbotryum saponariae]SDA02470.1 BZ3501_MvSof-1269-A2-R1_Chr12-3g03614 [Microbotryum saponariae]SDA02481.1 BZ3501_MvSof-1269-A2-R1_Chr12-3g03625 [Microbotryum saponariae]SDA03413.1 BZ3501_MvSof-1269-A2-R1_Chr11g03027 [Microbotryum saponariae]
MPTPSSLLPPPSSFNLAPAISDVRRDQCAVKTNTKQREAHVTSWQR